MSIYKHWKELTGDEKLETLLARRKLLDQKMEENRVYCARLAEEMRYLEKARASVEEEIKTYEKEGVNHEGC